MPVICLKCGFTRKLMKGAHGYKCPRCDVPRRVSVFEGSRRKNPLLGNCDVCGEEVVKTARICSYCGTENPVRAERNSQPWIVGLILFGVVGTGILLVKLRQPPPSALVVTAETPGVMREGVVNDPDDNSVPQVKAFLRENLKNPDSLEFMEWSKVNRTKEGLFFVRAKYRARNSFNALIVVNQVFFLDAAGKVINYVPAPEQ